MLVLPKTYKDALPFSCYETTNGSRLESADLEMRSQIYNLFSPSVLRL